MRTFSAAVSGWWWGSKTGALIELLFADIEWPQDEEELSEDAVSAIESLLTVDPTVRPAAKEVRAMEYFQELDWEKLRDMAPPFVPAPDDPTDTGYFNARNMMQHLKLSNFEL